MMISIIVYVSCMIERYKVSLTKSFSDSGKI